MTQDRCSRLWEAQAVEDGRFGPNERLSFERHAAGCVDCRGETQALAALRSSMAKVPALTRAPLEVARARATLLRRANGEMMTVRGYGRGRVLAFALVCLMLGAFGVQRLTHRSGYVASQTLPRFELEGNADLSWTEQSEPSLRRVVLRNGVASIHVFHLRPGQRFLATLPDGEIEVHGTRFTVTIDGHHTRCVEVSEGVVSLRIDGSPERTLSAGMQWQDSRVTASEPPPAGGPRLAAQASEQSAPPPIRDPAALPSPNAPSNANGVSTPTQSRTSSRGASASVAMAKTTTSSAPAPAASAPAPAGSAAESNKLTGPSSTFAAAMKLFSEGAYGQADSRFADFAREAPGDRRCEDAAFLRAVARARLGDSAGASALAEVYLARYPNGLRKQDAKRLIKK